MQLLFAAPGPRAPDTFAIQAVLSIAILAALAVLVLFNACRRARGTTLFAPLLWGLASFVLIVFAAIHLRPGLPGNSLNTRTTWWLIVATSSCCPTVALLGAKRPQNRAWQLIVLSLWGILALPAVQNLVMHPSDPPSVHVLWRWFYVILIFIGAFIYQGTLFGPASIIFVAGQTMLLWPFFSNSETTLAPTIGILITAGSILAAAATTFARRRQLASRGNLVGWNRVWLDFRDSYGIIWSLPMMERIDALLQSTDSPAWHEWGGFRIAAQGGVDEIRRALAPNEPGLRNLLRRFVSTQWIDSRLGDLPESSDSTPRTTTEYTVE